ncbi:SusC/RagA family TonB-linked outer membrane protein [Mesonia sp. K7]|uniref:SusC/RagA family TonB-linked outer membrane protein n=1 Tax=Mesonia sp. K7 TaxID=2218606 RepID=UPI000DA85288|nr:SusC/RagA family TonB-linked outer membrane protein [Mesonia sp. K7]PZD76446.1 SusC/RagA family TonB-linked outer membrane protein [Mesonia sp. K7]
MKNNYTPVYGTGLIMLLLYLCSGQAFAQDTYTLTGTVTDTTGLAIPGVHVQRIGSLTGTTTNFEGNYRIEVQPNDSLSYTYMGFATQIVAVNHQKSIHIQLYPSAQALDEVVINAGYYTTTERERTGSIERVTAQEIERQPIANPLQALQGRMAGVEVVQRSGVTGLAANIQIRGQNSLRNSPNNNGNLPLYIIDGVPINSSPVRSSGLQTNNPGLDPLNALNLANIESIEVLKDADATAIYGSRGANGVILITTKQAKDQSGKLKVNARLYTGAAEVSHKMELLNTRQYIAMREQALANDGVEANEYNAPDLFWDTTRYTDWQEVLFGGTATITNANIALSSGNETTSFLLGGGYHKEGTVYPGDFGYEKATANLNINHHSKDQRLQLNFSSNYGIDQNQLFNNTLVGLATSLPPNAPELYTDTGDLNWENWAWEGNPLAQLEKRQSLNSHNLFSNLSFSYELFKNFRFKANMGYSHLNNEEVLENPKSAYNPDNWNNIYSSSTHTHIKRKSWIIEPQLVYDHHWKKLELNTLAGLTFQKSQDDLLVLMGNNYANENSIGNLTAAEEVRVETDQAIDYRYQAIFGRIGLNWDKKYYLNLTGRRDGSSRFGSENRFANFGAIGAAWIFTEEAFIKNNLSWLSFGKLRGSYGTTGSDQIPDYGYMDTFEPTPGPGGLYPVQLTNPNYSWEVNKKLEAALELGLIDNRINLEINWYRNRSSNQLVGYPLPSTTGFTTVQANFPATVQNTGWELGLTTRNIDRENFSWTTHLNFTLPKNKLIAFRDIENSPYQNVYRVGQPLNIALRYRYLGIDPETGLYQVEDVNNDGSYDFDDRVVVEHLGREYYGGIQNGIRWKNIHLDFLFQYVKQQNYSYLTDYTAPGNYGNKPIEVLQAWEQPGDDTHIQQFSQSSAANSAYANAMRSDLAITDASFLRLKTATLSYRLPIQTKGIETVRIYMHGQNLLTLTDFRGLDPEGGQSLPPMRTLTMGVEFNF